VPHLLATCPTGRPTPSIHSHRLPTRCHRLFFLQLLLLLLLLPRWSPQLLDLSVMSLRSASCFQQESVIRWKCIAAFPLLDAMGVCVNCPLADPIYSAWWTAEEQCQTTWIILDVHKMGQAVSDIPRCSGMSPPLSRRLEGGQSPNAAGDIAYRSGASLSLAPPRQPQLPAPPRPASAARLGGGGSVSSV